MPTRKSCTVHYMPDKAKIAQPLPGSPKNLLSIKFAELNQAHQDQDCQSDSQIDTAEVYHRQKTGIVTTAVITLVVVKHVTYQLLVANTAKSPFPLPETGQSLLKFLDTEVRPQRVGEIPFRICSLPQQEIADPQLATGADDQIRIVQSFSVQILGKSSSVISCGLSLPKTTASAIARAALTISIRPP